MHSGLISFSEGGIVNKKRLAIQNDFPIKPYLRIVRSKEKVILNFDLDFNESILIYCKRGTDVDFILLTETKETSYIDLRPNETGYSETREYKAVFRNNGEVLEEADYIQIRTKGRFKFF
ncbi:MAG TPA: hypothetical protein VK766_06965 [Cytophagaceae bacterium]|jgi:hypothetical protein|nr:hypothetical protein [Cytophagaceae bacterium]